MIVDFRRKPPALPHAVESFRFLGTTISQDLKWDIHIDSIVRKAQQRLYFLRQLRKFNLPQELLKQFYSANIESVLCTSITVWFSSATKSDLRRLQRVVRTAERIIGTTLPTLQELYLSRVSKRAGKITLDPSHTAHSLFELLPSGRNLHIRPVHTWLCVLHSVFAILFIAYLYICILFFCCLCPVLLLSFCCTVKLCHYNKFLVCVNIPGQ